jgi:hypothetical protein
MARLGRPPLYPDFVCECGSTQYHSKGQCKHCYDYDPVRRPQVLAEKRARNNRIYAMACVIIGGDQGCACCGETEPLFLQIDHINNDGAEDRRKHGGNRQMYAYICTLTPEEARRHYQIYCGSCNHAKMRNGGVCPHQKLLWRPYEEDNDSRSDDAVCHATA